MAGTKTMEEILKLFLQIQVCILAIEKQNKKKED